MTNQRNITVKGIELFKEKDGWVIRNGMQRSGCYIDKISDKQLLKLFKLIEKVYENRTNKTNNNGNTHRI